MACLVNLGFLLNHQGILETKVSFWSYFTVNDFFFFFGKQHKNKLSLLAISFGPNCATLQTSKADQFFFLNYTLNHNIYQ